MHTFYNIGLAPCHKQVVTATIIAPDGTRYVATNHISNTDVKSCPRANMPTGQGYELCKDVCRQGAHAEVNACRLAGESARGGTLYLEGHTYACDSCKAVADAAGVKEIVVGPPPAESV